MKERDRSIVHAVVDMCIDRTADGLLTSIDVCPNCSGIYVYTFFDSKTDGTKMTSVYWDKVKYKKPWYDVLVEKLPMIGIEESYTAALSEKINAILQEEE